MNAFYETSATPNDKADVGNGSYGICQVIDASRSPSPDPKRCAPSKARRFLLYESYNVLKLSQ